MEMLHAIEGLRSWTLLGLPAFLFVITLVVFIHELGHFLVARACGVKVDVFSIGFGPEVAGFNDRSGTRWRISWLPVGGYVKFAGDANAASLPDPGAARAMSAERRKKVLFFKPLWQRAAVAAAGPMANFLLAILLLTGLLMYGGRFTLPPVVGSVVKGSPAAEAGIQPGDRITAIDGIAVDDYFRLPQIISIRGGENLAIVLDRHGRALTVHAVPRLAHVQDMLGEPGTSYVIGVDEAQGVKPRHLSYGLGGAFVAAIEETGDILRSTLLGVVKLAEGHASADQIRGTVGIMDVTQKVARAGLLALLNLSAVLSVSIGLANLFPIPVLDGGHLLYYACEAVLGRPLGQRAQECGFRFGYALIVSVLLFSTYNDLTRLHLL
jgi:regulator of sigma E protease